MSGGLLQYQCWSEIAKRTIEETATPMELSLEQGMPHMTQLVKDQHRKLVEGIITLEKFNSVLIRELGETKDMVHKLAQSLCYAVAFENSGSANSRNEQWIKNGNHITKYTIFSLLVLSGKSINHLVG